MNSTQRKCSIIMPQSICEDCSLYHWSDVQRIFEECIEKAGCSTTLIKYENSLDIISEEIISLMFDSSLVVCDISCKNSHVMFLLGQCLAFGKPTIIVKDDRTLLTSYNGMLEILEYPRSIQYSEIDRFKMLLVERIANIENAPPSKYQTIVSDFEGIISQKKAKILSEDKDFKYINNPRLDWMPIEIDLPTPTGAHNIPHDNDEQGLLKTELNNYSSEMVEKAKVFFERYNPIIQMISDKQTLLIIDTKNIPKGVSLTMIKNQITNSLRNLEYHTGIEID